MIINWSFSCGRRVHLLKEIQIMCAYPCLLLCIVDLNQGWEVWFELFKLFLVHETQVGMIISEILFLAELAIPNILLLDRPVVKSDLYDFQQPKGPSSCKWSPMISTTSAPCYRTHSRKIPLLLKTVFWEIQEAAMGKQNFAHYEASVENWQTISLQYQHQHSGTSGMAIWICLNDKDSIIYSTGAKYFEEC